MPNMKIKTKGNSSPNGKRRVYFTSHPEDFLRYFEKITGDIFKTHDVAIYYTEDMTETFSEAEKDTDLGSFNFFVVPVTFRLLTTDCRAMRCDLAYAKEHHIPILPFMMESGIDEFYAHPENFGERQYLNPFSNDFTEKSYEEKLKGYLESVLISDEMAEKVRAAFDAYIFLSYRKKDRQYANELMRLIHADERYRDIAIWYDEFLTPGESFQANIEKALKKSEVFALLVTPNLLEDNNFVMREEYPAAKAAKKPIVPTEMVKTDKKALSEKFEGIPTPVDGYDAAGVYARLAESLTSIAKRENDNDPMHTYLIGLAYLDGIDVEINRERGLSLVTKAAEARLPVAMKKLYNMYDEGSYVTLNYREALKWIKRLSEYYSEKYGEEHPVTLRSLNRIAYKYSDLGNHQTALKIHEKVYAAECRVLGEEHPDTLNSLSNLALEYGELGEYKTALKIHETVYAASCRILGEEHPDTLTSLSNLASAYSELGDHQKALEMKEKVYAAECRVLGEEHPDTLTSLSNLALEYGEFGDYQKAVVLCESVYSAFCRVFGEDHPNTLTSLSNLASEYSELGHHQKAMEIHQKVYAAECRVLGENHPDTLTSLNNLAFEYGELGDYQKSLELQEQVYAAFCLVLGEEHPNTLSARHNLARGYREFGDHRKAIELLEKLYEAFCRLLGEEHPNTLISLNNLAYEYSQCGDQVKAIKAYEMVCLLRKRSLGEDHPKTLFSLENYAYVCYRFGELAKALAGYEMLYTVYCRREGSESEKAMAIQAAMDEIRAKMT